RNVYRKVTRKIYDFSPEQEKNLLAIVWLYRGETKRYLDLVAGYCRRMLTEGAACFPAQAPEYKNIGEKILSPLPDFITSLAVLRRNVDPFLKILDKDAPHTETLNELDNAISMFNTDVDAFRKTVIEQQ